MSRKAQNDRKVVAVALAIIAIGLFVPASGARPVSAQQQGRLYPETGKTLAPQFIQFFDSHGGVPLLGFPLTDPETEGGFMVQYLERARIEYHPENAGTQYEVQLGLLGSIETAGRNFAPAPADVQTAANGPGHLYFPETQHTLDGKFLDYWQQNGGLALFGYPISEPIVENGTTVQYFQRNRFELHPDQAGTPYEVQLGLLGRDLLAQRVQVSETSVNIPTYGYEEGFYTPANDPVAPYPHLDLNKMGPITMRAYRLIVLENKYVKLSVLPQLGGRLYEAIYKPTGHDELYRNPVIKPAPFSDKGWWLGAGGMEWAAPTEEHGLMEYLPWDAAVSRNSDGGATVTVSAIDKLTGMKITGTITLSPEEDAYTVSARIENFTPNRQQGQLWTNAMVAPGGTNHVSPRMQFIIPSTQMVVHSTNDTGLPAPHTSISWPSYAGRLLSDSSTWAGWFGGFAPPATNRGSFAAVYNPDADEGLVKTFSNKEMPGLKIFGWGPALNPNVYTDGDSSYAELWGGVTPTFWDNAIFPPNGALGWTERWQPVAHTGGVSVASAWGTVSVEGNVAHVLPTRRTEGASLIVTDPATGSTTTYHFDAYPDAPAAIPLSGPADEIEVVGPDGKSLLTGEVAR